MPLDHSFYFGKANKRTQKATGEVLDNWRVVSVVPLFKRGRVSGNKEKIAEYTKQKIRNIFIFPVLWDFFPI